MERLSGEAAEVLALMQRSATPGACLRNEDLLIALARCGRGGAGEVLAAAEVHPTAALSEHARHSPESAPRTGADLQATLIRADDVRRSFGHEQLTTGHLLLALVDAALRPDAPVSSWWPRLAEGLDADALGRRHESAAPAGLVTHRRATLTGFVAQGPAIPRRDGFGDPS